MSQEQNIIEQIREDIIKNNNTAQVTFDTFIRDLKRHIEDINIPFELHGDLDLSILKDEKFVNLKRIIFREGEITSIRNAPTNLETLICPDNILKELTGLPGSLLNLDCRGNHIHSLDLAKQTNLQKLHCQDNKLKTIKNIPKTMIELNCDNNQLHSIDLIGLHKLDILSTSNNPVLIIENRPTNIRSYTNDNNKLTAFDSIPGEDGMDAKEIEQKINYTEALDAFFRLKNRYEQDTLKRKRNEYNKGKTVKSSKIRSNAVKPKCLNCARPVGTIFKMTSDKYVALCGDTKKPCKFNILLTRGVFIDRELYIDAMTDVVDECKETIIKQKMDTLFEYISEATSARTFKEKLEEFENYNLMLSEEISAFNKHYNDDHKTELIKKKQIEIYGIVHKIKALGDEYKENGNTSIVKLMSDMHIKELIPESENLRRLKYDITEMDLITDIKNDILIQYESAPYKMESSEGEEPVVKTFVSNL
jgi:hypothetical protein